MKGSQRLFLGTMLLAGGLSLWYMPVLVGAYSTNIGALAFLRMTTTTLAQDWPWRVEPGAVYPAASGACPGEPFFRQSIAVDPHAASSFTYLARCDMLRGDLSTAHSEWSKAAATQPTNILAYLALGNTDLWLGDTNRALVAWAQAGTIQPLLAYGNEQLAAQAWNEAEHAFRLAIQLDTTDPSAHIGWGRVLYRRDKDFDSAFAEFALVVKLAPERPWAYIELAQMYEDRGDFGTADEWYRQALDAVSGDQADNAGLRKRAGRNQIQWGKALLDQGDLDLARQRFEAALKWDGQTGWPLLYLGQIAEQQEDFEAAQHWFQEASTKEDTRADAYYWQAYTHYVHGQLASARTEATESVVLAPDSSTFRLLLGNIYRDLGQREEAVEQYRAVLLREPNNPEAQARLEQLGVRKETQK
jgi:tetratricopeptide (TPR) repeat protein